LADRIGISDKAVSKWERGLGLPEIGYLRKLSILLDTDTDSLLAGDVVHHDSSWSGVIILDENKYDIDAGTMIFDKPLIYYLLSYFLLVGIRDVTIVCSNSSYEFIRKKIGDGSALGVRITLVENLSFAVNNRIWTGNVMMVYGRCILYGVDQTRFFQKAMINRERFTMLVLPKKLKNQVSHIVIDQNKKIINSNVDEPLKTQYDFSDIPILFFPASVLYKMVEKSNISSFITDYIANHDLYVYMLDRGFVEIEIDDWNNVQEASNFIKIVQTQCGMNVYCIEEVAWRRGFISLKQLKEQGDKMQGTEYGDYVLSLYHRIKENSEIE
jgi:dTDP-glucose pyrophosphorylase